MTNGSSLTILYFIIRHSTWWPVIHRDLFTLGEQLRKRALFMAEKEIFPANNVFVTFFSIFLVTPIRSDKFLEFPH